MALALTTRLFDTVSGTQYLSATIGQIRYFSIPRVGLPETDRPAVRGRRRLVTIPGVNPLALPGQALVNCARPDPHVPIPDNMSPGCHRRRLRRSPGSAGQTPDAFPASDIVADVAVTAYKHLSVNFDYQWNPYTSQTDKSEISVQYRPDPTRVVNIGYRFQAGHPEAVGRLLRLADRRALEHRGALGLLAAGPPNHRASGRI